MSRKFFTPLAILAILALGLSACDNQAAKPADVNWWPWNWFNSTLADTLSRECTGLPAGSSVPVNGAQVPCPAAEAATAAATDGEFVKDETYTVSGPAIVQWWDGSTAGCGIAKVDEGRTFTWNLMGHWWVQASQSALNNGWSDSAKVYMTNNPQCTTALPAGVLK